jgi:hypothetical protein
VILVDSSAGRVSARYGQQGRPSAAGWLLAVAEPARCTRRARQTVASMRALRTTPMPSCPFRWHSIYWRGTGEIRAWRASTSRPNSKLRAAQGEQRREDLRAARAGGAMCAGRAARAASEGWAPSRD